MPLDEEGAKWACEPCIRGHRSSKCQHFDRLMMKVPKAGRPLAKCPHPKGTCSCQKVYAFMVRIPKGSTCLCRPLYKVPAVATENGQVPQWPHSVPTGSSPIPAPSSASSNRVQKRTKRHGSMRSMSDDSMKDLVALSTLQSNYDADMSPALNLHLSTVNTPHITPSSASTVSSPPYQKPVPCCSKSASDFPPVGTRSAQGTSSLSDAERRHCCSVKPATDYVPKLRVSCSSDTDGIQHMNNYTTIKKEETDCFRDEPHAAGSHPCFSSTEAPPFMGSLTSGTQHLPSNGSRAEQPPTSISAPVTSCSSPTIRPQYSSLNYVSASLHAPHPNDLYPQTFAGLQGDPNHNCGCGDGCQCLGCASHPFNETTRQYIQEMGYLVAMGEGDRATESPKESEQPTYNEDHFSSGNAGYTHFHVADAGSLDQGYHNTFEQFENIPLANSVTTASALHGQSQGDMPMHPNAYLTLEYPVNLLDPCTNMMGTCQCGINCSCVGCLTHHGHDGVSLIPSPPPDNPELSMQNTGVSTSHGSPAPQMPMYENDNEYSPDAS
ncbi:hypothetical protein VTO42DRAFT_2815 [Malbranchea cinnamomea]